MFDVACSARNIKQSLGHTANLGCLAVMIRLDRFEVHHNLTYPPKPIGYSNSIQ